MNYLCLASLLAVSAQPAPAASARGFAMVSTVMYQSDDVVARRVPSVPALADYILQLEKVAAEVLREESEPEALDVVVAVRPGGARRVWFVPKTAASDRRLAPLRARLEAVPAPVVREGVLVFAMVGAIAGASRSLPTPEGAFEAPTPEEWKQAAKAKGKDALAIDPMIDLVWPSRS